MATTSKLVDDFIKNGGAGGPASSGLLGGLGRSAASRQGASAASTAAAQGSPLGLGGYGAAASGRGIVQQGMGAVAPVQSGGGQLALGAGPQGSNLPAVSRAAVPSVSGGATAPGGMQALGAGSPAANPGTLGGAAGGAGSSGPINATSQRITKPALSQGASTGTSASRLAAQSADDLVGVAGRAATQGADDVAGAAARQAGTAARTAGQAGMRATATNLGVNITKAGAMRGAGMAGAGLMASQFFDGLDLGGENSTLDRGGSGAILGAGLGGGAAIALGLGSGPAGWAALGGAALIGGYQALWGDDETTPEKMTNSISDTRETIASLGEMYGIEGGAMDDIMLQYEASTAMYMQNNDSEGLKQFMAGMGTQLPALMLQAREQQKAEGLEQDRYNQMMQAQAQFAPIFERTLDRASQASQTAFETANNSATYLDQRQPQLAALYRQTAAQSQASAANLQAAYAQQMAQAPVTQGTTQELERQLAMQELMNQQMATMG